MRHRPWGILVNAAMSLNDCLDGKLKSKLSYSVSKGDDDTHLSPLHNLTLSPRMAVPLHTEDVPH
jgi:hypothetical protein